MYDIHPILVHFPIALLFLYSVVKILPFSRFFPHGAWKHIERAFLFFGFVGACAALITGETAEHLSNPQHNIVEMHSTFATIATYIYGALLTGEIASILNARIFFDRHWLSVAKISRFLEKVFCNEVFSAMLSVVGLVCITLTGLLGGVMVFGTTTDPIAGLVLKLLGLTITP